MKKLNKTAKVIGLYLFILIFFHNCSTNLIVQKRLYRKGFNIGISTINKNENQSSDQKIAEHAKHKVKTESQTADFPCLENSKKNEISNTKAEHKISPVQSNHERNASKNENDQDQKNILDSSVNLASNKTDSHKAKQESTSTELFILGSILSIAGAFIFLKSKKSKQISIWAKENKSKARILLTIAQIALVSQAIYYGNLLKEDGITLSKNALWIALSASALGCLLYPYKNSKLKFLSRNYFNKKAIELVMIIGSFFSILTIGNQNEISFQSTVEIHQNTNQYKHEQEQKKVEKKSQGAAIENNGKIALFALATIISLGLLLLIAVLSCNLACTGAIGAFLLLVGSSYTAIILSYIFISKRIFKKKESSESTDKKPSRIIIPIALGVSVALVLLLLLVPTWWSIIGVLAFLVQKYWIISTIYSILATIAAIIYK
jgi:hypothetical protein